jgi:hypothetical protein
MLRDYKFVMSSDPFQTIGEQLFGLFVIAVPIACVVRTVIFEEVFREPREWCQMKSRTCDRLVRRKFYYLFTCEYCFSHYVTLFFLLFTGYKLLLDDWRGYVIAFFSLVMVANFYLNIYARLRLEIQKGRVEIKSIEKNVEIKEPTAEQRKWDAA